MTKATFRRKSKLEFTVSGVRVQNGREGMAAGVDLSSKPSDHIFKQTQEERELERKWAWLHIISILPQ